VAVDEDGPDYRFIEFVRMEMERATLPLVSDPSVLLARLSDGGKPNIVQRVRRRLSNPSQ